MTDSIIGISEGSGKNWRTNQRTVGANDVEEQYTLHGDSAFPTYTALAASISTATSADHLIFLQADGTLVTKIKRIFVEQVVGAGSATLARLQVWRASTAGSGGGAITAEAFDSADTYTGTIETLPSSKGTELALLLHKRLWLTNTIGAQPVSWEWLAQRGEKPIVLGPASTDGIILKIVTGIATATVDITIEFTTDAAA